MKKFIASLLVCLLSITMLCQPAFAVNNVTTSLSEQAQGMLAILDSIIRVLTETDAAGYAPADADFFWNTMYYCGVNWGYVHPSHSYADYGDAACVSLPRSALHEYAAAAFYDYDMLPPLTDGYGIRYDPSVNSYLFAPSDSSTDYTVIERSAVQETGNLLVSAAYHAEDGTVKQRYEFTLVPSDIYDTSADMLFAYRVMAVNAVE